MFKIISKAGIFNSLIIKKKQLKASHLPNTKTSFQAYFWDSILKVEKRINANG